MNRALPIAAAPTRNVAGSRRLKLAPTSLFGLIVWLVAVPLIWPGWAPALLLFGPLVLFALVFEVEGNHPTALRRLAFCTFLPVIVSYVFVHGIYAGALTLPWLGFALVFLGYRLPSNIQTKQYVSILIKGYLIVGACWLVLARCGIRPLNFEHVIVHATALHFHYAGFVLPILGLQVARQEPSQRRNIMLSALLLGVPLVAVGITLSQFGVRWVECAAAWIFSGACIWFAVEQLRIALAVRHALIRGLLLLSSLSLIAAMSLALLYATGNYLHMDWLDIPFMLRWHGPIQVFGFAMPGVVAWSMVKQNGLMTPNRNP
jgi:YndJ-like protein